MSDHKQAKNDDEFYNVQETYEGKPHGWVQWKGTNVCMDVYCDCGVHGHIDDDFVYHVKCRKCGRAYYCNGHIELVEITGEHPTDRIATFGDDEEHDV